MDVRKEAALHELKRVFEMTGWDLIKKDLGESRAACQEATLTVTGLQELGFLQGKAQAFAELMSLDTMIEQILTQDDADL